MPQRPQNLPHFPPTQSIGGRLKNNRLECFFSNYARHIYFVDFDSDISPDNSPNILPYFSDSSSQIAISSGCHSFWRNDLNHDPFQDSFGVILLGAMRFHHPNENLACLIPGC
jgi:hypothetical protein